MVVVVLLLLLLLLLSPQQQHNHDQQCIHVSCHTVVVPFFETNSDPRASSASKDGGRQQSQSARASRAGACIVPDGSSMELTAENIGLLQAQLQQTLPAAHLVNSDDGGSTVIFTATNNMGYGAPTLVYGDPTLMYSDRTIVLGPVYDDAEVEPEVDDYDAATVVFDPVHTVYDLRRQRVVAWY